MFPCYQNSSNPHPLVSMQTFLPYPSYKQSAECLDRLRLGKQRVECLQLTHALLGYSNQGWLNHPACKAWRGYEAQLIAYGIDICDAWLAKGYQDTVKSKLLYIASISGNEPDWSHRPAWITEKLCLSHRSNLIRKLPEWYRPLWPDIPDNIPYHWPVP